MERNKRTSKLITPSAITTPSINNTQNTGGNTATTETATETKTEETAPEAKTEEATENENTAPAPADNGEGAE
jgi:hypothetical protein